MAGLDVAVVGGGLGGLAAAIALRRAGHRPVVYEQTAQFRPVGAGISLWPNGVKVLGTLGLDQSLVAIGGRMDRMGYADRCGEPLTDFSLMPLYEAVGTRAWPVARADLQDLLVDAVGREHIRFGTRCVAVSNAGDGATVYFRDGSKSRADLVVGADGTHSRLRSWVAAGPVERRYVGYVNVNGITPADTGVAAPGSWRTWVGDGKRASVMPIGGGRFYTFFDLPMPLEEARMGDGRVVDELTAAFDGWAAPVQTLIRSLDPAHVNRVPIFEVPSVERWYRGRIVLLGDAVHAMAPDLGQGGCQALEDALVLAQCLADGSDPLWDALARYQADRQARTADIVRRARQRADLTHGVDEVATRRWYASLREDPEAGRQIIAGLIQSVVGGPCG